MRIKDVKPVSFVSQLQCGRCGAEAQHNVGDGFNNFLQIEFDGSWGSAIGDGIHVEIDLCHRCLKETLGPWLRFSPAGWMPQLQFGVLDEPEDLPPQERRPLDDRKRLQGPASGRGGLRVPPASSTRLRG